MQGRLHTIVEVERVVMDDSDDLFERRYPGWEIKFNNDKLCFFMRSDPKPAECKRMGDRVWVELKIFNRIVGFDIARPGAQKSLDEFKRLLTRIDLAREERRAS